MPGGRKAWCSYQRIHTRADHCCLFPKRFLRNLPVLDAFEWWEQLGASRLRTDLDYDLMTRVSKHEIVAEARKHPEIVEEWIRMREVQPATPYNFETDPKGVWKWD